MYYPACKKIHFFEAKIHVSFGWGFGRRTTDGLNRNAFDILKLGSIFGKIVLFLIQCISHSFVVVFVFNLIRLQYSQFIR
jgi:hypothetical protein